MYAAGTGSSIHSTNLDKFIDSFSSNSAYRYRQTKQQTVMET